MGFTAGRLILLSLALLIFFGVAERVLDRMHMNDKTALLMLGMIVAGSFINVTLYQSAWLTVKMNVGGALVPLAVALYVWTKAGTGKEKFRSLAGAILTTIAIWFLGRVIVNEYALPIDIIFLYPIIAGVVGYLFGRSRKGAFVAAVLGVLFFDATHGFYLIWKQMPGLVHFGGGGMYDSVVLSGVLAVLLAEFIGESRERLQGGPKNGKRDGSVLRNLQTAGMKGDKHHG